MCVFFRVRLKKTQISLSIKVVVSESGLCPLCEASDTSFLQAGSKDNYARLYDYVAHVHVGSLLGRLFC